MLRIWDLPELQKCVYLQSSAYNSACGHMSRQAAAAELNPDWTPWPVTCPPVRSSPPQTPVMFQVGLCISWTDHDARLLRTWLLGGQRCPPDETEAGAKWSASLGETFASTCCRVSSSRCHSLVACHQGTRPSPLRTPRRRQALHRSVSGPREHVCLDAIIETIVPPIGYTPLHAAPPQLLKHWMPV